MTRLGAILTAFCITAGGAGLLAGLLPRFGGAGALQAGFGLGGIGVALAFAGFCLPPFAICRIVAGMTGRTGPLAAAAFGALTVMGAHLIAAAILAPVAAPGPAMLGLSALAGAVLGPVYRRVECRLLPNDLVAS